MGSGDQIRQALSAALRDGAPGLAAANRLLDAVAIGRPVLVQIFAHRNNSDGPLLWEKCWKPGFEGSLRSPTT